MTLFLLILLACLLLSAAVQADAGGYSLKTDRLTVGFDTIGGKLHLSELGGTDGHNWICATDKPGPLWTLSLIGDDSSTKDITSSEIELSSADRKDGRLTFAWKTSLGDKAISATMSVYAVKGDNISHWSLKIDLPDGWKVARADFPIIPDISTKIATKMAAPLGWGLEYDVKPGMGYEATYPSMSAAMQFLAFYGGGKALYVGAHDAQANHKVFSAHADDKSLTYKCANWPGLPEKSGGEYKLPYEAAVGVVDGGWYEAAQVYRNEFALKAPWSKAGPVSKRPIPQWLKDNDLWLRVEGGYDGIADSCKRAREYFKDIPTSLHWYKWHEIPYDTLYPDYFPTKPGFAEGVKALQAEGYHVMPYINGRIVDPNSKGWNEEGLSKSAARDEKGEPYTEVYGSKVPLNSMCPYTTAWQDKVTSLVDRLTHECGVDSVYIDQIGCAWAYRCYDKNHGHPLGGGHFWVDGYRKLLDKVRAKLPNGKMITTEENIECFIDQFDALLLVNTPCSTDKHVIPLFPAVYSGRTITFGFQYIIPDDLKQGMPFRAKMAQEFTYGAQIGWVLADQIMAPESAKEAEFVRNLAKCHGHARKFLLEGRFLGLVDVKGDNPRIKFTASAPFGGEYELDTPSVIGSAWEAEDGSIGIALANMSDEAHRVEFSFPETDSRQVTVPARDAVVWTVKKEGAQR